MPRSIPKVTLADEDPDPGRTTAVAGAAIGRAPSKKPGTKIVSLRFITSAVAVSLIVAAVLSMGLLNERYTRNSLTEEIENRLLLEARNLTNLSVDALLLDYPELVLQPVIKEIVSERPEFDFVVVLDHEGRIQGHVDARMLRKPFEMPQGLEEASVKARLRPGERFLANEDLLVAIAPANLDEGQRVGTAIVGLERSYLTAKVLAARKAQLITMVILLVAGTFVALLLVTRLMRPIKLLRAGLERIGGGDLDTPLQLASRTELGQLADTVNEMASKLKRAQAELVDKERLAYEMEIARKIQRDLLPEQSQRVGEYTVLGFQNSATEVGGDYYDTFSLPNGKVGLAIADVAGKGLAGCLATFMIAALVRAYRRNYESPTKLLAAVEEQLAGALPRGTFVTMFYGILDPASGRLVFCSAGHSPTLVYRAKSRKTEWYKPPGRPLVSSRKSSVRATRIDALIGLEVGDILLQFTDGINEAWNRTRNRQFDFGNIERVVAEYGSAGAPVVLRELERAVEEWVGDQPHRDDETMLLVVREGANAGLPSGTGAERISAAGVGQRPAGSAGPQAVTVTEPEPTAPTESKQAATAESKQAAPAESKRVAPTELNQVPPTGPRQPAAPELQPVPQVIGAPRDPESGNGEDTGAPPIVAPLLDKVRERGAHLFVPDEMPALERIGPWVRTCEVLAHLGREDVNLIHVALHEVCANIIEHGVSTGDKKGIDLYWYPDEADKAGNPGNGEGETSDPEALASRILRGYFIVCDQTVPFDPGRWRATHAKPAHGWQGSRGYGIEMVYRAMSVVHYQPSTPAGNITMMRFDPLKHRAPEEVSHV